MKEVIIYLFGIVTGIVIYCYFYSFKINPYDRGFADGYRRGKQAKAEREEE